MAVAVDLDQRRERQVGRRGRCYRLGLCDAVQDHCEINAARSQGQYLIELLRRDADAVDHVGHTSFGEDFGLAEGRDHRGS